MRKSRCTCASSGLWHKNTVMNLNTVTILNPNTVTILHVNRSHIQKNKSSGTNLPLYTIKIGGQNVRPLYAWAVRVLGPSYLGDPKRDCKPLHCGAQAYITTENEIVLYDADGNEFSGMYYEDALAKYGNDAAESGKIE